MIRILVADDHSMFRKSLRAIIEGQHDMDVVAEADNGLSAIKLVQRHKPDVILMDVRMPVINGIDATAQITSKFHGIKIIALSSHSERVFVEKMLEAGASDYMSKYCNRQDLINCIYDVFGKSDSKGRH